MYNTVFLYKIFKIKLSRNIYLCLFIIQTHSMNLGITLRLETAIYLHTTAFILSTKRKFHMVQVVPWWRDGRLKRVEKKELITGKISFPLQCSIHKNEHDTLCFEMAKVKMCNNVCVVVSHCDIIFFVLSSGLLLVVAMSHNYWTWVATHHHSELATTT